MSNLGKPEEQLLRIGEYTARGRQTMGSSLAVRRDYLTVSLVARAAARFLEARSSSACSSRLFAAAFSCVTDSGVTPSGSLSASFAWASKAVGFGPGVAGLGGLIMQPVIAAHIIN